jgi:hypothetical protein
MKEEDQKAYDKIRNQKTIDVTNHISKEMVSYIDKTFSGSEKNNIFQKFAQLNNTKKGIYPTLDLNSLGIKSTECLLKFLSNSNNNHIAKLSILWMLSTNFSGKNMDEINHIYSNKISKTKDYIDDKVKYLNSVECLENIGNSGEVKDSQIFRKNIFIPWKRDIDYRALNAQSSNNFVQFCMKNNIPYIAGASGMANMYCKVMDALSISPHSERGETFIEAASSFIVSSGMHSYAEVNHAFNLYSQRCHQISKWPDFMFMSASKASAPERAL